MTTLISDDRITVLAKEIAQALVRNGAIPAMTEDVLNDTRRALTRYCQAEAGIDQKAREKIATLKRGVAEGSREWDILYQKYYEEELNKQG